MSSCSNYIIMLVDKLGKISINITCASKIIWIIVINITNTYLIIEYIIFNWFVKICSSCEHLLYGDKVTFEECPQDSSGHLCITFNTKNIEHSQDAFNGHQHCLSCSEVLFDCILAALCTICHHLHINTYNVKNK